MGTIRSRRKAGGIFNVDQFCVLLIAGLVIEGRGALPIGDPKIENALAKVLAQLHRQASEAWGRGDEDMADEIIAILDQISPNPNTGAFDLFWAAMRQQQPGRVGVSNPRYKQMNLNVCRSQAELDMDTAPKEWRGLAQEAAKTVAAAIST